MNLYVPSEVQLYLPSNTVRNWFFCILKKAYRFRKWISGSFMVSGFVCVFWCVVSGVCVFWCMVFGVCGFLVYVFGVYFSVYVFWCVVFGVYCLVCSVWVVFLV